MMEANFKQLVDALSITPFSNDLLPNITLFIKQQIPESISLFISQSLESLLVLKQWTWQQLSHNYHQWINQSDYINLFDLLALFNKHLIFHDDNIDDQTKALLIIPDTIDQINGIFEQINHTNDDNSVFIVIINLWFDNLSFFIDDYPQFDTSPVICHINQYLAHNYLMTDQFKIYLIQLQQQSIFSARQLFYIKTCSFSLASYFFANAQNFPFTTEQMLEHICKEYLQIINNHIHTIPSWNQELLSCIAYLTRLIHSLCWWGGEKTAQAKILFSTEQISNDLSQALVQIISYEPFYQQIQSKRWNNETILIDTMLRLLLFMVHVQNMAWLFRLNLSLPDTLLIIAEKSTLDEICLYAYVILGEVLTEEKLKKLKATDNIATLFMNMLADSWHHPLKKYKQIPLINILTASLPLTKSDAMQQKIADSNQLSLFIEISNEYPITYDILWTISFNKDIQQQIRSNSLFMSKLIHLAKECENEQLRKMIQGILWNLEINHNDHSTSDTKDQDTFDIMISYSHKDKTLCQQIYDELIKANYRVWIDFDQMHGNVMDAMAQAIEQSHTVIICMSEDYRKSNYCRAEAHYAFQRQRKIVPVLLQKHYKPDGWLLFIIGQLLYVDFTKYEFNRAIDMLFKELKGTHTIEKNAIVIQPKHSTIDILPKLNLSPILPKNILDWKETHVQSWLSGHHFLRMSDLLVNCNGRSLLYLNEYIRNGDINLILNLLQEDSLQKTGQTLSLTELVRFRSLIDEQQNITESTNNHIDEQRCFVCCRTM